jgi:hypothetical protein
MRTTIEKRKEEKTKARLGESLKKKWESRSTFGSNTIIIERNIL